MQQWRAASPASSSSFTNTATMAARAAPRETTGELHQEFSYFLIVTSVRVRGLPEALADAPLAVELVADSCSLLTDPLVPLPAEKEDAPQRDHLPPARRTLGLDHLRIVIPIVAAGRGGGLREAAGRCVPPLHGCGGVHVVLRTAHGAAVLGGASCCCPGDWFPLAPCGGEAQVGFKVYRQRDSGVARSPGSGQLFLDGQAEFLGSVSQREADLSERASVATDEGTGAHLPTTRAVLNVRQVHSAGATPRQRLECGKRKPQPLDLASGDPDCAGKTSRSAAGCLLSAGPHVSLMEDAADTGHTSASGGTQSGRSVRMRECQPRSLVFSHIQVSGFHPISSNGSWRLEFTWPQHKVSPMRRTVQIPTNVDANGAVAVHETLSIDLPLFMRGEVQTCMHAVWFGSSSNDPKTRLYLQVEFDPLLAVVRDHEMRWEECRRHFPMLMEGLPLTVTELCVRLVVGLEFYEPQRDGQNGRPTSAFPRHRGEMASAATAAAVGESDEEEREVNDLEEQEEQEELTRTTAAAAAVTPPSADAAVHTVCQPAGQTGAGHGLPAGGRPGTSPESEAHAEAPAPPQREQRQQRGGTRSLSPRRPTPAASLFPEVESLVPCYSDEQREEVFRAYDTENCGRMTLEQLLHFCRAHVALYDGVDNDVSILRGLRPYVPCAAHRCHTSTHFSSPSSRLLPAAVGAARPEHASAAALAEFAGCESEGITYGVFEIIALRLASM
ncbi:uncharacterized protein Tco025E_03936 [Trypanosoma conorhini]|uniref:EF-hand domain-containing protein n=1 Tax=Trypanosoma conorhini TaxID=83891 RepID=A0A422PQF8_9TRYP|nr:uncharacterized protein Tco025E_03936 [Trypanosoma conorhini]RNF19970.1 hypothetical protein Tco025E_03936 [Trypanosoma conorhini]